MTSDLTERFSMKKQSQKPVSLNQNALKQAGQSKLGARAVGPRAVKTSTMGLHATSK
jgi:hypothetical protein